MIVKNELYEDTKDNFVSMFHPIVNSIVKSISNSVNSITTRVKEDDNIKSRIYTINQLNIKD